jgi:hypothetical protein
MSHWIRSNLGVFTTATGSSGGTGEIRGSVSGFVRELRIIHELAAPGGAHVGKKAHMSYTSKRRSTILKAPINMFLYAR